MKIRQLHINRFGHFHECDLVFPGDGLQVIYGPNEAGKTTLLEFLRGLLFDFPPRTPYDFGDKGEMAGVATLELRDGRAVELRRRKGNKDKVAIKLDGQPTDLDDAGWLRLLDHADRGLFESVFAFGLDQLSQGEATLKHESLQSALFGGSLGGNNSPDKVVAELTRQADDLFKKSGSKPAINVLLADLKKLTKEIKDKSLRPEKFHEAEATVTKAAERAKALHDQVDQLRREHSKIEKRVRAWPKWWELQQRRSERDQLGMTANPPLTRSVSEDVSEDVGTSRLESPSLTLRVGVGTTERAVGWDQRRFAAPAHHAVETHPDGGVAQDGGPSHEACLSHPTSLTRSVSEGVGTSRVESPSLTLRVGVGATSPPQRSRIPADARQTFQSLSKDWKSLADERAKRTIEAEQFERSLTALKLDPGAVSYRAEIKSCLELRQSFIEAQEQLPERIRQREAMKLLIDRELTELRPGWTHDDLRAFSVDVATRAEIDRLSDERRERATSNTKLTAKRDSDATNLDRAQDDLAEIGSPRDVTALAAMLADEADFVASRKQAEATRADLAKLERKLATQCRKLTPPMPTGNIAPHELPVPRAASIADFDARFAELREQLRIERSSFDEDAVEQNEIKRTLANAMSSHVVPSLAERDAARARRDAGWELVRQKYVVGDAVDSPISVWLVALQSGADQTVGWTPRPSESGQSPPASTSHPTTGGRTTVSGRTDEASILRVEALAEGYEQAVRIADTIADQIYDNANEVAEREGLRRQLATLAKRLDQKRQRIADLERQQADLQTNWRALWQPCGFEPLAPDAMRAWLDDHEAACAAITQREELVVEQSQLAERIAAFELRLRAACGCDLADEESLSGAASAPWFPGVSPSVAATKNRGANAAPLGNQIVDRVPDGGDLPRLLTAARQSVEDAKDQQRRATELQKEARRLDKQLAKYDADLQSLTVRETAANAEWLAVLSRLNLPADWTAELAREVIDKLSATRVRLDGLPGEEARITAMQSRITEFDQRVHALCEALEPELLRAPSELAIEKLAEQVERAVEAQRKHDDLSHKLSAAREQSQSLSDRHMKLDAERVALFALANAANEAEFLEVVSRAEKIVRLNSEIEQLQREVDLIRAGDDRDEFETSLAHSERAVLEGEQRDLAEQLRQQEQLKREADEAVGAARKELAQLDGSGTVAILNEDLARKRSELAADVDRYMPLVYARHLLNAAVSRFEKENQPEMIATVSRLLAQMTGGKYIEFDRSGGSKQHVLIRRADGVERTPDQLSTGTREQLYLAIRLAYVLHYCEKNQPLPIIIDDVLVNFDEDRTRQTLATLADVSRSAQVLFFTCHPHMVRLAREVVPGLNAIELSGRT